MGRPSVTGAARTARGASMAPLLQPGEIGRLRLKNRLLQSAMHTRFASDLGEVTERLIEYHAERARGGVAMIILENTAVNWEVGRAAGNPVRIDRDLYVTGLHRLVEAIHREGATIATQLHHAGRQNVSSNIDGGGPPLAPSEVQSRVGGDPPRAMTKDEIAAVVDEFAAGARRTVQAGFDAVEVHGSHGYLLTQFLSPSTNRRDDDYGGSFENRARFPLEVVNAVREAVGPDFPVIYRISLEERTEGGMGAEEGVAFCKLVEPYVDAINVTAGIYESMEWIFTPQGVDPGSLLPLAKAVKDAVDVPVIGISRLGWLLDGAAEAIEANELDYVAMARTQLADPQLVAKTRRGDAHRVRRCIACNECVGGFLFQGWSVQCVINPELGNEYRLPELMRPAEDPKRVLVVGGGVSGCEAARVAAVRGHSVRLVEQAPTLGGQVRAVGAPQIKRREMDSFLAYYEAELDHLGVEVVTGAAADGDLLDQFDRVLLATGSETPDTPDGTVDAVAALTARELPAGGRVTVVGNGSIGIHAAAFAAEQGREVKVVPGPGHEDKEPGHGLNPLLAGHLLGYLDDRGVTLAAAGNEPDGAELVLWAPEERRASRVLEERLTDDEVVGVGTRVRSGGLYAATQSGFWTGARV
jgi:dimethylglycine catabolism A